MNPVSTRVTEQPDLAMVVAIHRAASADATSIAAALGDLAPEDRADRIPTIRHFLRQYSAQLVDHHMHEDHVFFPALAAKVGPTAMRLAELEAQHRALDDATAELVLSLETVGDKRTEFASAKTRATSAGYKLAGVLDAHLVFEEQHTFALYLQTVTADEHAELESRAVAMTPAVQRRFFVPWLFDRLSSDDRAQALDVAPVHFRTTYENNVANYRRLVRALRILHSAV